MDYRKVENLQYAYSKAKELVASFEGCLMYLAKSEIPVRG
jgi:hypothetical protein